MGAFGRLYYMKKLFWAKSHKRLVWMCDLTGRFLIICNTELGTFGKNDTKADLKIHTKLICFLHGIALIISKRRGCPAL